jgi:dolichyl-phosphate beta-glucosyltransferase
MNLVSGKFVIFMDADLSTPIDQLTKFLPKLQEGFQVVIGTRKSSSANIIKHQPLWRESMGKAFTWLSNKILQLDFSDFTCGFKAFESGAGKEIFSRQTIDGWAFDSEILFLAGRLGFNICEIPVTWVNSEESKVRPFRAAVSSFVSLVQIRWKWKTGKYTLRNSRESGRIPADV